MFLSVYTVKFHLRSTPKLRPPCYWHRICRDRSSSFALYLNSIMRPPQYKDQLSSDVIVVLSARFYFTHFGCMGKLWWRTSIPTPLGAPHHLCAREIGTTCRRILRYAAAAIVSFSENKLGLFVAGQRSTHKLYQWTHLMQWHAAIYDARKGPQLYSGCTGILI